MRITRFLRTAGLFIVSLLLASVAMTTTASAAPLSGSVQVANKGLSGDQKANNKYQIFTDTNKYRAGQGVKALHGSVKLDKIAQTWAETMARESMMYHNPNVFNMVLAGPHQWVRVGENVAYGYRDGKVVTQGWIHSPGHRANMIEARYNRIGIGVAVNSSGSIYYAQVFGANSDNKDPILSYSQPKDPNSPFVDVRSEDKFFKEIKWMYTAKLSSGIKSTQGLRYAPKSNMSREAMAAFMYRLSGEKGYKPNGKKPFSDIPTNHKFYKEISWMKDRKLSTGVKQPNGTYAYKPKSNTSREAMAAFMYRYAGKPAFTVPSKPSFSDVPKNGKFYKEISWMKASGLSGGAKQANGSVKYLPKSAVSREAMAAFMYRYKH